MNNNINNDKKTDFSYDSFLMNKFVYQKYLSENSTEFEIKKQKEKDEKEFYAKRISSLTKNLLKNSQNNNSLPKYLLNSFESYTKTCIKYFKSIDKKDIIQSEYKNISNKNKNKNNNKNNNNNNNNLTKANEKFCEFNKHDKVENIKTIENFINIKKKNTKAKKKSFIPIQKNIDLCNPILKTKGIEQKNTRFKIDLN